MSIFKRGHGSEQARNRHDLLQERVREADVRVGLLEEAIDRLQRDLEDLKKPVRDMEMEWESWFDKFRNLYARHSRRAEREAAAETPETAPTNPAALRILGVK